MIKKHVFALSLALFTAAVVLVTTSVVPAEASSRQTTCRSVDHNKTCRMQRHVVKTSNPIGVADDYIGLTERAHRRQLMGLFDFAYDHKIDPSRTKWCAAFVNGVLVKSGKKGTGSATAASFLSWGKRTSKPATGDIVVLSFKGKRASHVGFYMGTITVKGQKFVKVLGGNQKNSVKVTYYPIKRVVQYRTAH